MKTFTFVKTIEETLHTSDPEHVKKRIPSYSDVEYLVTVDTTTGKVLSKIRLDYSIVQEKEAAEFMKRIKELTGKPQTEV